MSRTSVKVIDKGWNRIKKEFLSLNKSYAKVGVVADSGTYADGVSISLVGAVLHYGNNKWKKKKKWEFITNGLSKGKNDLNNLRASVIKQITAGSINPKTGLELIGQKGSALIKKEIKTIRMPDIEEVTKIRKGSTKPLIDTGQLLNSISHEVKI